MSKFITVGSEVKTKNKEQYIPYVTIPLINKCNQKCVYCGDGAEMTLCDVRFWEPEQIFEWYEASITLGVKKFRITGGEPLLHKDFNHICKTIAQKADIVLINSNGTLMEKYKEKWSDLPDNCMFVLNCHGSNEKVYDRVSGTEGKYPSFLKAIDLLQAEEKLMRLNAVFNHENQHDIFNIIDFCRTKNTHLKIQDVVSVPWAFNEWDGVYVDSTKLEQELDKRSSSVRDHEYAKAFGTPSKIYDIAGVNVTLKSVRNGAQYDSEGICKDCEFFPCHEGIYDLFLFADDSAWACNWTDIAKAPNASNASKIEQLKYQIDLFQKTNYVETTRNLQELKLESQLPERSKIEFVEI